MKRQNHHWIPLGLMGVDRPFNIANVSTADHATIHMVCNYPYRTFTDMWRAFRRRHNHHFGKPNEAMIEDILRMQEGYLSRYVGLPEHLQKLHFRKMNEICRFYDRNHTNQYNWGKLWYEYCEAFKNHHL